MAVTVMIMAAFGVILTGAFIKPVMWQGLAAGIGYLAFLILADAVLIRIEQRYRTQIDGLTSPEEAAEANHRRYEVFILPLGAFLFTYFTFLLIAAAIFILNAT